MESECHHQEDQEARRVPAEEVHSVGEAGRALAAVPRARRVQPLNR